MLVAVVANVLLALGTLYFAVVDVTRNIEVGDRSEAALSSRTQLKRAKRERGEAHHFGVGNRIYWSRHLTREWSYPFDCPSKNEQTSNE